MLNDLNVPDLSINNILIFGINCVLKRAPKTKA